MLFDLLIDEPLAYRMRPRNIDELVGQKDVIGKNTALYKMIKNGFVPSMLLYGVPGVGKTSLAEAIAGTVKTDFISINATTAGKKDMEEAVEKARMKGKLIIFIDEVHRFNKAQQDYLLPHVAKGLVTLIGATTENPFHEVNPAIRSRCGQIKELKPLQPDDIKELLLRALSDKERGLGHMSVEISETCLDIIARSTNGDARSALTVLEEAIEASKNDVKTIVIEEELVKECVENKGFSHDKNGDVYYSLLSALQKSIRGSDVDASLHYLARLIEGGDLESICRRLIVIAYEDISIASPDVAVHTMLAVQAVERIGLPEARIPLANIVVEQCLSPKTNSAYKALDLALADVRSGKLTGEIPDHLKDAHYKNAYQLGHGVGYKYPHAYPNSWVNQEYLPTELKNKQYFFPKNNGKEEYFAKVYNRLESLKSQQ